MDCRGGRFGMHSSQTAFAIPFVAAAYVIPFAAGQPWTICAASVLLVCLASYCVLSDISRYRLHDWTIIAIAVLGAGVFVIDQGLTMWTLADLGLRCILYGVLFEIVRRGYSALRGREGLGFGDVKLAAASGGWLSPEFFGIAVFLAAAVSLALVALRQRARGRPIAAATYVPYGAALAMSVWMAFLLQHLAT